MLFLLVKSWMKFDTLDSVCSLPLSTSAKTLFIPREIYSPSQ